MLNLILAESAIETIPSSLWKHPFVRRISEEKQKPPSRIILDRSYHHSLMKGLPDNQKRGRPDIVHFSLIAALNSPLNKESELQIYVHTIRDYVINVNPITRLPRNYNRFVGLIEHLFEKKWIPSSGPVLLKLEKKTLSRLIREIEPSNITCFSRKGSPVTLKKIVFKLSTAKNPLVIIGGFPHGHFSKKTMRLVQNCYSIDPEMLDASMVVSRVIYEYERTIFLTRRRRGIKEKK